MRTSTRTATAFAEAHQLGWLPSDTHETALRDRWAQECAKRRIPILHVIRSRQHEHASIRLNSCTIDAVISPAGLAIARAIVLEHGGHIRRLDEVVIDIGRVNAVAAVALLRCFTRPEFWAAVEPERRYWI